MRILATEIFKIINNLNPNFIKNIFTPKWNDWVEQIMFIEKKRKKSSSANHGDLQKCGTKLPQNIKREISLITQTISFKIF